MTRMPRASDLNRLRRRAAERRNTRRLWGAAGKGLMPPPPRAFAAYGAGTVIVPPTRVQAPECIRLGSRVIFHEHAWLCVVPQPGAPAPLLEVGDGTSFNRFIKIICAGHVTIGENVLVGDHVFIDDTHYRYDDPSAPIGSQPLAEPMPVVIGSGTHLGFRVMILPGVTIGENAYVGAGAVVTEDVPARTVVVGDPARQIRRYDEATRTWVDARSPTPVDP
jgi:acetyltransferase-like isoleucine patch superfamily enzyme